MIGSLSQDKESDGLQRTEAWRIKRGGCYTGSKIDLLQKCGKATAKTQWGSTDKLVDFGVPAERYIYAVGMERRTKIRSMDVSAKQMEHGTVHEPLLIERLLKDGVISDFKELGFEYFGKYENGGASVDGICIYKGEEVGLELKCTVSWDGHYKRMYEDVHDKHDDFWQFQAEMLATGLNKLLYVVAMPMQVEKYDFNICHASPIHQDAMLKRCKIADKAIELWDQYGYKEALHIACAQYKDNIN